MAANKETKELVEINLMGNFLYAFELESLPVKDYNDEEIGDYFRKVSKNIEHKSMKDDTEEITDYFGGQKEEEEESDLQKLESKKLNPQEEYNPQGDNPQTYEEWSFYHPRIERDPEEELEKLKKYLQDFVITCTSKKEEQQLLADSYFEALKRNKIVSLGDVKSKTSKELFEIFKVGRPVHGMMLLAKLRNEQIERENRDILIKYSVILQMEKQDRERSENQ